MSNIKLYEILMNDNIKESINDNINYLLEIIPEIEYMIGFDHKHPHHHLDVFEHTLLALSISKKDFIIRISLLLHDIGKPFSYQEGEIRHFNNHPIVSSNMAKDILKRLNFDNKTIDDICYLIKNHDNPISNKQIEENYNLCLKLYEIQRCDALAHNPDKLEKRKEYLSKVYKKILLKEVNY